ncbi:cation/multidrug efflux pump [Halobacteroides halobius DSM 5150]|uniref:Cation/multidrug efflux pump n=1 Tax=Halobacteroides halobius (strain ATCC 35273 / DSM 5150 / MD-1) TaxID=748449 RepID=L0KAW6_HALHC|nr:efflux RND transporter permease subunit [Halobacteroides halobius]AGB41514.1 cation/multidrug efflux pump [Halobacteroides halobius DSM 5150]
MMKLSDFSVERPVTVVMMVLLVLLLGTVSLTKLPVDLLPKLDLPYAVVMTNYSGAAPKQIEETVTKPIEEAIATVDNVKNIISISNPGSSLVIVEFDWGTDLNFATLDMRENISLVERMLPDDVGNPRVLKFDPTQMPIMRIGMSGDGSLENLKAIGKDVFKPTLERIPGVASVSVLGGLTREIQINVDQERLMAYGLTLNQISSSLRQSNLNLSGGSITRGNKNLLLKTVGEFNSIDQIRNLELLTPQGAKISLKHVAKIIDTHKEIDQYTYLNGKRSIGLSIQKQSGANTVEVAKAVKKELANLKKQVNTDIQLEIVQDQAEFIAKAVNSVKKNGLIGAGLAMLVLFLFLRDIRSTFIIGTAIPISVVVAFTLMYFADLTLNLMTLGGVALGIGMLVDNAIVVLENIYRHRQENESRLAAAKKGTAEVGTAIMASTLTTAAVFLPIVYIEGLASQLFGSLALTVTFSLVASLLVALTLIPMLSSKLLTVKDKFTDAEQEFEFGAITQWYQNLLKGALRLRYLIVALTIVIIVGFGLGVYTEVIPLKSEFIPKTDQGAFTINIDLAQGKKVAKTKQIVKQVEAYVQKIPEVDVTYSSAGGSGGMMSSGSSGTGQILVKLVDQSRRTRSTSQIVERLRNKVTNIVGAEIKITPQTSIMGGGGGGRSPIEVMIQGPSIKKLTSIAHDIEKEVKEVSGTRNVKVSISKSRPEAQVKLKRDLAKELGFNIAAVAKTIKTAVKGQVVTKYQESGEEVDVRLQLRDQEANNLSELKELNVTSRTGITVPLAQIAKVRLTNGLTSIERENQQRIVRVQTSYYGKSLSEVQQGIKKRVSKLDIPAGYTIEYGGQVKDMRQSFGDLGFALVLAVILVYMVIASQFESLIHPLTIMFTVPLSLIGAVLGLVLTGNPLSVPGIIGMIMLAGIVVNNAIVMIDYINTRRKTESREEAILKAGPIRLRPIMMTTLTTVLGLVPIGLGIGEGSEVQQPMAIVVIAGLLFATILTLVVLPAIYSVVDDISKTLKGFIKRLLHGQQENTIEA